MDNSFFILSKQQVEISRFHICTWDIENKNSFFEIGVEFMFPNDVKELDFKLVLPSLQKKTLSLALNEFPTSLTLTPNIKEPTILCLSNNLVNLDNSKFIFNDNILNFSEIKGDKRNGAVLSFESRTPNKLAISPAEDIITEGQVVSFKVRFQGEIHCYTRLLIKTPQKTLATEKKGITQTRLIYDFKLNERRNLPENVYKIVKKDYSLCKINNCFCFHVVPNSFNISFVDQTMLKNIRKLEVLAFNKYFSNEFEPIKEDRYMIIFNKHKGADSYSFFTIFTKEIIGAKQVLLAIGANILCCFLFSVSALRTSYDSSTNFWEQIPLEYWIAIAVIIVLFLGLLCPFCKIKTLLS